MVEFEAYAVQNPEIIQKSQTVSNTGNFMVGNHYNGVIVKDGNYSWLYNSPIFLLKVILVSKLLSFN